VTDAWDDDDRAIASALHTPADRAPLDDRAVAEYREVLAHLPVDEVAPPRELEDRVLAAALARRPASPRPLDNARSRRRSRARAATLGAVAVAAAIAVALLVTTRDSSAPAPTGRIVAVAVSQQDFNDPGTRTGRFDRGLGTVALNPAGNGGILGLGTARAVGVWVDTKRGTTSLGAATAENGVIAFTVEHPDLVTAVRITEPGGAEIARAPLSAG
jgi:hypothetical protein